MKRGAVLLQLLLFAFAAHGLAPEALDPWRAWVVFKQYARQVAEEPDPGVSVQITADAGDETTTLVFLPQTVECVGNWIEPTGGVICELTFPAPPAPRVPSAEWDAWSFEHSSFERFVDRVEQHPAFQDLMVTEPLKSAVYWREA